MSTLPVTAESVEFARRVQAMIEKVPQVDIRMDAMLHDGIYTRTAFIPAGVVLVGALLKVPTTLTVVGKCKLTSADGVINVDGFGQFAAPPGRKTVFRTATDTVTVMAYRTNAKTCEEARREVTDEILIGEES